MRRIAGMLFFLLMLDQLAKNLVNSFIPVDTILSYGSSVRFVVGNSHHYADPEFPVRMFLLFLVGALALFVVGYAYFVPGKSSAQAHILWFGALCCLFEAITQGIDHALHGYVINYVGFYVAAPVAYAEIAHIGDYIYRFGVAWSIIGFALIAQHELARKLHLRVQPS